MKEAKQERIKNKENLYDHWFSFHAGISLRKKHELLKMKVTPEALFFSTKAQRKSYFTSREEEAFLSTKDLEWTKRELDWLDRNRAFTVFWKEENYPPLLKQIDDFPLGLYVKGCLPDPKKLSIGMVGAREMTPYGKDAALFFAEQLAKEDVQIISGLARGIDACCHRKALQVKGYTLGVLACGIDVQYPRSNGYLYEQMEQVGGLISEFPIGSMALKYHFPIRNRIISGISNGVFVLEAKKKSGSLITANQALEQGRDVFALPGRYYDDTSLGAMELIQSGAKLVYNVENITEEYHFHQKKQTNFTKEKKLLLDNTQKVVYDCLRLEPKHIDTIVMETGLSISEVLAVLTILEVKKEIIQTQKSFYRLKE